MNSKPPHTILHRLARWGRFAFAFATREVFVRSPTGSLFQPTAVLTLLYVALCDFPRLQVKDRLKMHKKLEEDRISGALNKPSAEDEFDSRVRESEVRKRPARAANASHRYRHCVIETR